MRQIILTAATLALLSLSAAAAANETLNYSYDARGRLKQVAHTNGPNNGKTTSYTYDKADNRTVKTTS